MKASKKKPVKKTVTAKRRPKYPHDAGNSAAAVEPAPAAPAGIDSTMQSIPPPAPPPLPGTPVPPALLFIHPDPTVSGGFIPTDPAESGGTIPACPVEAAAAAPITMRRA